MQVQILSGIYSSGIDWRTSYPRNYIPVPKETGISKGYLRPAEGIVQIGAGPGTARGGIAWNGVLYRVFGSKLCTVSRDGTVLVIGDVGDDGAPVTMDYSFDRLAIASAGVLYYWTAGSLLRVSDADLGQVVDMKWIDGYFMTTDGQSLVVTELSDPTSVNPLKYGSAESDPDPVMAVDELRTEAYAFGRYTVEVFENIGGTGFPFRRIAGAQVTKGAIGSNAYTPLGDTFVFVGSGRGEAPAVYKMVPGNVEKVSTREIDQVLAEYTEAQLAQVVVESRVDKNHQLVLIHLPDQCLVYDTMGSQAVGEHVWFTLTSSIAGRGAYRARYLVWCYDQWNVADTESGAIGVLTDDVSTHWGQVTGWDFGVPVVYANGQGAIVHELELVCLTGRVSAGVDPVIWTQYSYDGETWSMERATKAGKQGERTKRICWRTNGVLKHVRMQRFRGTSDAHLSVARLEIQPEPLFTKAMAGVQ